MRALSRRMALRNSLAEVISRPRLKGVMGVMGQRV